MARLDPYIKHVLNMAGVTREGLASQCQATAHQYREWALSPDMWAHKATCLETASHFYKQARLLMGIEDE